MRSRLQTSTQLTGIEAVTAESFGIAVGTERRECFDARPFTAEPIGAQQVTGPEEGQVMPFLHRGKTPWRWPSSNFKCSDPPGRSACLGSQQQPSGRRDAYGRRLACQAKSEKPGSGLLRMTRNLNSRTGFPCKWFSPIAIGSCK